MFFQILKHLSCNAQQILQVHLKLYFFFKFIKTFLKTFIVTTLVGIKHKFTNTESDDQKPDTKGIFRIKLMRDYVQTSHGFGRYKLGC